MSDERKDVWKVLYTMVNRNQANLEAVYSVVDNILCRDPSLICCSSLLEVRNEFQDVFLLWLLNKLAASLSRCQDKGYVQKIHIYICGY